MRHAVAPLIACLLLAGCETESQRTATVAPHPGGAIPVPDAPTTAKRSGSAPRPAAHADAAMDAGIPPLPADVDLSTTATALGAQALIVAQEEHARGDADATSIPDRHRVIYLAWLPQMQARQAYLQQLVDERKHEADRQVADAVREGKHQEAMDATDARLTREVEIERRKTVPILSNEDRDRLH